MIKSIEAFKTFGFKKLPKYFIDPASGTYAIELMFIGLFSGIGSFWYLFFDKIGQLWFYFQQLNKSFLE